jgi:uncharacterized delta-60 repeat protein
LTGFTRLTETRRDHPGFGSRMKKLTISVSFFLLLTLPSLADGRARLDPTFGDGGIVVTSGDSVKGKILRANAVVETPRGQLVTLGNGNGSGVMIKLDQSGERVRKFGRNGILQLGNLVKRGTFARGVDLTINGRGTLFPVGSLGDKFATTDHNCLVLSRFAPDGILDLGFANGGRGIECLRRGDGREYGLGAYSIDLTGEGKLLVSGNTLQPRPPRQRTPFVARFKRNGSLDRTFAGGPRTRSGTPGLLLTPRTNRTQNSVVDEVRSLRERKVLGVGALRREMFAFRLNPNGTFDSSFGRNGIFRLDRSKFGRDLPGEAVGVDFDRRGRIVVAGYLDSPDGADLVVFRLTKRGRLDRTFGNGGVAYPDLGSFLPRRIAIQPDEKFLVAGGGYSRNRGFAIARLTPRGFLDTRFFDSGLFYSRPSLGGFAEDVMIDRRGRIVATGGGGLGAVVVRILPGG